MMVAHVAVNVSDWEAAKRFYEAVLGRLGYASCTRSRARSPTSPIAWDSTSASDGAIPSAARTSLSTVADRETVDAFYANALGAGGRDNGPPGIRPQYDANYYAAYVLDPDGNNIEAVCHHAPS